MFCFIWGKVHFAGQANLLLMKILLPHLPRGGNYRPEPPWLAHFHFYRLIHSDSKIDDLSFARIHQQEGDCVTQGPTSYRAGSDMVPSVPWAR